MTKTILSEDAFWEMIETAFAPGQDSLEDGIEQLRAMLEDAPREHVVAFQVQLNAVMSRAYTWKMIAASCFVGAGQSDDGFEDFRAWLVAQGRASFTEVVEDPSRLAHFPFDESPIEEWHLEELHMLPGEIGGEEEDDDWPYLDDPDEPVGERIQLTMKDLQKAFPALWDHFGTRFMIVGP